MTRILVVEDDIEMGALVERGLVGEGYEVLLVGNGMDALIALATGEFAAAAIDVMLPQMSGFEICRRIRETGSTMPVILLTARDAIEDRVFGLDSGADDYLTKPFAIAELNARIRAQLRRQGSGSTTLLRAGDLTLDTLTVRASVRDRVVALSVKEFSLLRLLVSRIGRVVTRHDILEDVWGSAAHFEHTIVDQYISYLRKKLELSDAGLRITTVRGAGYQLDLDVPTPDPFARL
ncbi:MAG: response regulator transcription factor [Burkholderiaceae bacterium]|nr:response regulator transcription factor [Microbacteriaceae bacterium]